MRRLIVTATVLLIVCTVQGQVQPPPQETRTDLTRNFEIGQLSQYFKLVKAEEVKRDPNMMGVKGKKGAFGNVVESTQSHFIQLHLEAVKEVNPSAVYFKAGIFDKDKQLTAATPLYFSPPDFPLQRGESIKASFSLPAPLPEGYRISVRLMVGQSGGTSAILKKRFVD